MAIEQLTPEQVQTWSRQQKDRWWFENIFRGDMPQLTIRSAITGFLLGGILSATNLYVGAKTGLTLGVGLTSVIIAFAAFRVLAAMRLAKDFTILENNAMQSIATSAGYMTAPLVSSLVAYMWIKNETLPWHQILFWNVVLSIMGVLVAFPMKRRFINDEQQPFPEGRACGVVLDMLYTGKSGLGMIQAKALLVAGLLTAFIQFIAGEAYMTLLWVRMLGFQQHYWLNEKIDTWYYTLAAKNGWTTPTIGGIDIRELALRPALDLAMIGTGGLMGLKTTSSLLVGMAINFVFLAPWMINAGNIVGKVGKDGVTHFGRTEIVNQWAIWWGVGIMVVGSLVALFAKPQLLIGAFRGLFAKKQQGEDVLGEIELPLWVSFTGLPICAAVTSWMAHEWYGVSWWLALLCLPLVFALSLICANAMALTSWTPTGSLSKITQFTFGAIERTNPATNLMTAGITAEVASNAANLLSDIKPGYMLGAKPRQQAVGHVIGIISGAAASTPLFYVLFTSKREPGESLMDSMTTDKFTFPAGLQWKGVADIIAKGFGGLSSSIQWSLLIAAAAAVIFEIARIRTKGKFWLSPVGIGLGVVLPPDATFMMWIGSVIFWALHKWNQRRTGSLGHTLWVLSSEPICAGIIAGAALTGIGDKLVEVFLL